MNTPIMSMHQQSIDSELLDAICHLPTDFHQAGVMADDVLHMMARLLAETDLQCSAETGCGKTTLLFSQLSRRHLVFAKDAFVHTGNISAETDAIDEANGFNTGSIRAVENSQLLKRDRVELIIGATQATLPVYQFTEKLDAVLIDGPHGYPFPELEYYYFYPQLKPGALLFLDDIHIPTIWRLFEFLLEDEMFELVEVCAFTAAFRRTDAVCFDPEGDGWWLQAYNAARQAQSAAQCRAQLDRLIASSSTGHTKGHAAEQWQHDPMMKNNGRSSQRVYQLVAKIVGKRMAWRLRNAWQAYKIVP